MKRLRMEMKKKRLSNKDAKDMYKKIRNMIDEHEH